MNFHNPFPFKPILLSALMLFIAWLLSGCSGSNVPDTSGSESSTNSTSTTIGGDNASSETSDEETPESDGVVVTNNGAQNAHLSNDSLTQENNTSTNGQSDVSPSSAVTSPIADNTEKNTVLVNFEITVPAYQSDKLRVELIWGDINLSAKWVGDEYWSVSGELPANTEHPLTVTFYDFDGDITLAKFTKAFSTGPVATESIQLSTQDFDDEQFDTDGDGISNLSESITGTDPLIDEDSLLEIHDSFYLSTWSRMSVSQSFESRVGVQRPFVDAFEQSLDPEEGLSNGGSEQTLNVNIDAEGNGTLSYNWYVGYASQTLSGIRTSSENSVSWEGTRRAYQSSYNHNVDFTNTVTVVDENTRELVEDIVGSNMGAYTDRWETSINLTGELLDGTRMCSPVAGTVSTAYRKTPPLVTTVTNISKSINDAYWRVVRVINDTETSEYFVRELKMLRGGKHTATYTTATPENAFFICDFADI